jgi:hypothetical protein
MHSQLILTLPEGVAPLSRREAAVITGGFTISIRFANGTSATGILASATALMDALLDENSVYTR